VGEDAKEFEAAGIYDPNAPNAKDRLASLRYLAERGATMQQLVTAARARRLPALAAQLAIAPGPLLTMEEAAAEAGMTAERVAALSRIVGLAPIDPKEPTFTFGAVESFRSVDLGIALFGRDATIHFGRVLGNAIARIAEAAQSAFLVEVEAPMAERHATEYELVKAQADGVELLGVIPQLMETLLRAHVAQAIGREITDIDAAYQGVSTVAVGFVDLVGFTPLSQSLAPDELMKLVSNFEGLAIETVATYGGRVVKLIGDEVMFSAQDAASGCAIALDILDAFKGDPRVEGRGGLHIGPTLAWGGDRYGATVNCASRVSELAVPHELLVTDAVRAATPGDAGFVFEPAGRRMLRGFPDPVALYSLTRS
jgi:adenylate cyclase